MILDHSIPYRPTVCDRFRFVLIALAAGSVFIGFGLANGLFIELFGPEGKAELAASETGGLIIGTITFLLGIFASFQLAGLALLPVTIAIATTEMMRWRGMTTHLILGGLCALFVMFSTLNLPQGVMPGNGMVIVSLASGFIAAFFYWLIAGRNAGEWLSALGDKDTNSEG
ncbi:MAG: hypothetical protein AAF412_01770 [Pseudomonadota bacterium]